MLKAQKVPIDGLDFVKCTSITLIVFHHYQQVLPYTFEHGHFFGGSFYFGLLVELFFMVSGFLALYTYKKPNRDESPTYYLGCFVRKLIRFVPMTTIALVVCVVLCVLLGTTPLSDVTPRILAINAFLLFAGYPRLSMLGFNNPTWYLCILVQCFALFYLVVLICDRVARSPRTSRFIRMLLCLALVVIATVWMGPFPEKSHRGIQTFFIGAVLCDTCDWAIESRFWNKTRANVCAILFLCIAAYAVVASAFVSHKPLFTSPQRLLLVFVAFPLLLLSCFLLSRNQHRHGVLRKAAAIAFEVYIWHYPLMVFDLLAFKWLDVTPTRSHLTMACFTVCAWLFAYFAYRYAEVPLQRFISSRLSSSKT